MSMAGGGARAGGGDDKSLLNSSSSEYKTEYEVDEVYKLMGSRSRFTVLIVFVISLFGETFAPFGVIAPILQTQVPDIECFSSPNCTMEKVCKMGLSSPTWEWVDKHRSIVSEFDLECQATYTKMAAVVFFIPGMAIGLLIAGYLSDKIGRKSANIIFMFGSAISSVVLGFSVNFTMYLVAQTFLGVTLGGTMVTRVIWMLEFVSEPMRPYASAISAQFFCVGSILVAVCDYYLEDWRMLDFIIAVYSIVYVLVMVWVPESPHWLAANQRDEELMRTMRTINNINRKKIPIEDIRIVPVKKHGESGNICIIFSDRKVACVVFGLMYQWVLASFLYYGFLHLSGSLNGSIHWNMVIMGILEGPCLIIAGLTTTRFGRRTTLIALLVIVIVSSIVSLFSVDITEDWDLRRIFSLIASKAGSAPIFFVIYILTLEIIPTSVRAVGMSVCSVAARSGAAVAPFIDIMQGAYHNLPYLVIIVVCLIGLGIAWLLPETKGTCLKQTYGDQGHTTQTELPDKKDRAVVV